MSILASACAICTQCARSAHAVRTQCEILALLYYDSLLRETLTHHPVADLYVFVDDIAVKADYPPTLTKTLNQLLGITPRQRQNRGSFVPRVVVFLLCVAFRVGR